MRAEALSHVKGFLLDINGVFYVGDRLLEGAVETLEALHRWEIPFRVVTNNTTESLSSMVHQLNSLGLPIVQQELISASQAAVLYLRQLGNPTCYLLLPESAQQDFQEFNVSDMAADVVVVGDIGNEWSYQVMNRAFRLVMQGAELVALHKGRYWQWEAGLQLDIGAFVAGLEYATGKMATVVGKPSTTFFRLALADLGMAASEVAMVGDDIEADVGGAQSAGLTGILVKTGKYREKLAAQSTITPHVALTTIGELVALLS